MAAPARHTPARAVRTAFCCAVLLAAVSGCSLITDIRREPPVPALPVAPTRPASNEWLVERRPEVVDVRQVRVPVAGDFGRPVVEFSDAGRGAALFTRCGVSGPSSDRRESCTARLFTTEDGGRSWRERRHPRPNAANQQLYVGADGTVLLLAEPHGWYLSTDVGRTFRILPYRKDATPSEYHALFGRFQVCCDSDDAARVVRWSDDGAEPVPTAPPLPGSVAAVGYREGKDLWAASIDDGRAHTAVSTDGGRTWRGADVPGAQGGLEQLRFAVSADLEDVWLLGSRKDRTRFPAIWRLDPAGWRQMPAIGHPEEFISAAPVGAGLLAVTAPVTTGLAGERYTATDWPSGGWIHLLGDGTLSVNDDRDGSVWLGEGRGVDRRWAQVQLRLG